MAGRSRMSREIHVRICGGLEVRFLRSTRRRADEKGEIQVVNATRASVPMPGTGAEQPVVVMKRSNVRGAKGLRHSVAAVGQPERGGADG